MNNIYDRIRDPDSNGIKKRGKRIGPQIRDSIEKGIWDCLENNVAEVYLYSWDNIFDYVSAKFWFKDFFRINRL